MLKEGEFLRQIAQHLRIPLPSAPAYLEQTALRRGRRRIDPAALDNLLCRRHGNFEKRMAMSTLDLLAIQYGAEARDFVATHLG